METTETIYVCPNGCKQDTDTPFNYRPSSFVAAGEYGYERCSVFAYPNGEVSNRFVDGTVGVPKNIIEDEDTLPFCNVCDKEVVRPPKPYVVAIDETQFLDDEIRAKTGRFWTLYLYDKSSQTHCCEITPSYWLTPFDYATEKKTDDELDGNIRDSLRDSEMYVYTATIDALEASGWAEPLQGQYVTMDEAEEDMRGNPHTPRALLNIPVQE